MQYIDKVIDPKKKGAAKPWGGVAPRTANSALLHFGSGSRTKTQTGQGILARARREASEASLFSARRAVLSTPTHRLAENVSHGRVVKPGTPGAMVSSAERLREASAARAANATGSPGTTSSARPVTAATNSLGQTSRAASATSPPSKRSAPSVLIPQKRRKH